MKKLSLIAAGVLSVLLSGCGQDTRSQSETSVDQTSKIVEAASNVEMDVGYNVPVEYFTLDNGLKVVLSKDDTAPVVTVAVYYNIGFRNEPKDRTGFAHLFEHMMFQGSENLGKMEFIKLVNDNGGV